jgi:hypothetical protein
MQDGGVKSTVNVYVNILHLLIIDGYATSSTATSPCPSSSRDCSSHSLAAYSFSTIYNKKSSPHRVTKQSVPLMSLTVRDKSWFTLPRFDERSVRNQIQTQFLGGSSMFKVHLTQSFAGLKQVLSSQGPRSSRPSIIKTSS